MTKRMRILSSRPRRSPTAGLGRVAGGSAISDTFVLLAVEQDGLAAQRRSKGGGILQDPPNSGTKRRNAAWSGRTEN
ncbi:hypothetical protein BKA00_002571 [Actinomadura coerulea]|uniref:Uncharacterized protein n=1 Tax=Actinomadura coerulea TaxID=46159 RepID=A0A7X0KYR3_9ACTN|nr:hypothetical protein [Actinomadura coerulea]MBB6395657.1 hypothetical protein [Actinomadura coerulea]GGQ24768.1 hypothetical protein GCM10010187_46450 [Actinomadura coerulea]